MLNKKNIENDNFLTKLFFNQKVLAVIGLVIIVIIIIPLAKNIAQRHRIEKEIKDMESEISQVENKNNDLRKLIDYFQSDQFLEEQARLNFGLKKNNEQVAIIKNNPKEEANGSSTGQNELQIFNIPGLSKKNQPFAGENMIRWYEYFFKK